MDSWGSSACYPRRTFYPLSDGPPHMGPPDHYDRLSTLLDVSVSQSGRLMPLHSTADFRPALAPHPAPPLPFGRRPPQSNYPPYTVPDLVERPRLDIHVNKGGISRTAPRKLAPPLHSLPPILHMPARMPV